MILPIIKTIDQPDGKRITIETGRIARQADGSVVLKLENTMLLATVVSSGEIKEESNFFPLSVDYQERFAASGRIPGGFFKREGRSSSHEILVSRLVDRAIRPLFPEDYLYETQINIFLISADQKALPDSLAALAASAALSVSDVPVQAPISEVRVVQHKGIFKINPTQKVIDESCLNLIVAGTFDNILMVEGEMKETSEEEMLEAIQSAHKTIKTHCVIQETLSKELGISKRKYNPFPKEDLQLRQEIFKSAHNKIYEAARTGKRSKRERNKVYQEIKESYIHLFLKDQENIQKKKLISRYLDEVQKDAYRELILKDSMRLDGRKADEIRSISSEIDYLPSAHGSALFTRGETQSLTSLTLGTRLDEQIIDGAMIQSKNRFLLHYNFPAFSTGEIKPNRGPSRREIGHGNLAQRALTHVLPPEDKNPYTIRVVSDILESNGSSSMATVCAGSLALMDAGIQIKRAVSGIAMGMILDEKTGNYVILSDILGDEDYLGDMDFKIAGTEKGITACQMDIKVKGITHEMLKKALFQAKGGRLDILKRMEKVISKPRENYKSHAPCFANIRIASENIRSIIGPGGKVIQEIQKETNTTLIIDEKEQYGMVQIFGPNKNLVEEAMIKVKAIIAEPEIGKIYTGIVKSLMPYGAFVEFLKGKQGLLHISEISWKRVENVKDFLREGEEIQVKLMDIDRKTGKFKLSAKALLSRS